MLKKVILLVRHGQRAPFDNFTKLNWTLSELTNLTPLGKSLAIEKGKALQKIYHSQQFKDGQIVVHSSNFHRTIETAYYVLSNIVQKSSKDENIDSHIEFLKSYSWIQRNQKYDAAFRGYTSAVSPYGFPITAAIRKKEDKNLKKIYKEVYPHIKASHGFDLFTEKGYKVFCFIDHLRCLRDNGLELPFKRDAELLNSNEGFGCRLYIMKFCNETLRRLCNHSLYRIIYDFINNDSKRMLVVGMHDYNLVAILVSFGLIPERDPDYLASIRIEVGYDNRIEFYYDDRGVTRNINKQIGVFELSQIMAALKKEMYVDDMEFIKQSGNVELKMNPKLLNSETSTIDHEIF